MGRTGWEANLANHQPEPRLTATTRESLHCARRGKRVVEKEEEESEAKTSHCNAFFPLPALLRRCTGCRE